MKQPHIYTLPERFIKDPSVPLRWKLYTIINGFWISGKPVFAGNEFFAEKLGCSERHVRECLLELEKMYLITRHGSSQKRRIIPGGHGVDPDEEGRSPELRGGGTGSSAGEEPRAPHIADSIADRDCDFPSESALSHDKEEIRIVPDGDEEKVARVKADPRVREIALKYMKRKGLAFKDDAHMTRDLARSMKAAKKLLSFSGAEILKGIEFCEEKFGDMWTLETVVNQMSSINKKS